MSIPHIILSVIIGVVAALAINLLSRWKPITNTSKVLLFIVLCGLLQSIYMRGYVPQKRLEDMQQQLETMLQQTHPIYQTLKQQESVTYNRLKDKMIASAQKNRGKPSQQLMDAIQVEIATMIFQRTKYAPNQNIIDLISIMLEEMRVLHAQGNDTCFKYLFPQVEGGINSTQFLPAELIQRDLNSKNALLIASYGSTQAHLDDTDAVESDLSKIYVYMARLYGDKLDMLDEPYNRNIDRQLVCEMSIQFYQQVLALPPERSAPVIRMLLNS